MPHDTFASEFASAALGCSRGGALEKLGGVCVCTSWHFRQAATYFESSKVTQVHGLRQLIRLSVSSDLLVCYLRVFSPSSQCVHSWSHSASPVNKTSPPQSVPFVYITVAGLYPEVPLQVICTSSQRTTGSPSGAQALM